MMKASKRGFITCIARIDKASMISIQKGVRVGDFVAKLVGGSEVVV